MSLNLSKSMTVIALAMAMTLVGCFKPQSRGPEDGTQGDESDASSTFYLEEVSGEAEVSSMISGFSIPNERLFNFKVQIKDRRTLESLKGQRFSVTGTGLEEQGVQTDASGYLRWRETIRYNFLADEVHLPLRRRIVARGTHSGFREVRVAINPWQLSSQLGAVVDLNKTQVPENLMVTEEEATAHVQGLARSGEQTRRFLWLTRLEIENNALQAAGGVLKRQFRLKMSPAVLHRSALGTRATLNLTQANLAASAALMEITTVAGQETRRIVWSTRESAAVQRLDEVFKAEFEIALPTGNPLSRYELMLRVSPVNGPAGLVSFEGLYQIGGFSQLTGQSSLLGQLKSSNVDGQFAMSESLRALGAPMTETVAGTQPLAGGLPVGQSAGGAGQGGQGQQGSPASPTGVPAGVSRARAFEVGLIRVGILGIDGENSLRRTIRYNATVCLTDTASGGAAAIDVPFTVVKSDGTSESVIGQREVEMRGCIRWEDRISHSYYAPERFIMVPVVIKHESGFEERRVLALNPWDRFGFGRDSKEDPRFIESVNRREAVPSRLLIDTFDFGSIDTRDYEVDEFMNLKINKHIRIRIPVRVQRHSSIMSGRALAPEPLRDGIYLLKAALHVHAKSPSGQNTEIVAPMKEHKRLVRVRGAELKADITFDIPDSRMMLARATLVFEVKPVDESKLNAEQIRTLTFAGDVESLVDSNSGLVHPTYVGPMWVRDEAGGAAVVTTEDLANGSRGGGTNLRADQRELLRPLANMSIDELIAKSVADNEAYRQRMGIEGRFTEYLKRGNLEYVPVANESRISAMEPAVFAGNEGLPKEGVSTRVLQLLNATFVIPNQGLSPRLFGAPYAQFPLARPVTRSDLREFIEGRKEIEPSMAARFCVILLDEMANRMSPEGKLTQIERNRRLFADDCVTVLASRGVQSVLGIDRKLRIFKLGSQRMSDFGRSMSFSVGADVSFGRSTSTSAGWSYGWSSGSIVESVSRAGIPGLSLLATGVGMLGVSGSWSRSFSDSTSVNEGSSFSSGTSLDMERIEMEITAERYESCAVVRIHPEFIESRTRRFRLLNSQLTPERIQTIFSRGLMLCTGFENRQPVAIKERYYSFAHNMLDQTLLDRGDVRNHPWFMVLRGTRDYATFLTYIAARKTSTSQVTETIDVGDLPLDRLSDAYRTVRHQMPTMPGFYSFNPRTTQLPAREATAAQGGPRPGETERPNDGRPAPGRGAARTD